MLVWGKNEEKMRRMVDKSTVLESRISELSDALKRDESLLDLFESPLWPRFVETVLSPEKSRLAERRMGMPIEDKEGHLLITGQYNEAVALSRTKEEIVETVDRNLKELSRCRDDLAALQTKINHSEGVKQ